MIPIYEQGTGNGIGHELQSFMRRFDEICDRHLATGRARAFAFIFYDFSNQGLRSVLNNQGVFARLDRLSGHELSVFYLHANTQHAVETFNSEFITALGVEDQVTLPCVVFFRVDDGLIKDVEIAVLESSDLIHGFNELHQAFANYLQIHPQTPGTNSKNLKWLKVGSKFIGLEIFKVALKKGLEFLF